MSLGTAQKILEIDVERGEDEEVLTAKVWTKVLGRSDDTYGMDADLQGGVETWEIVKAEFVLMNPELFTAPEVATIMETAKELADAHSWEFQEDEE
jgi:hypothetical protein